MEKNPIFKTENGAKYEEELLSQIHLVSESMLSNVEETQKKIIAFVKGFFGDNWTATFSPTMTTIGMIDETDGCFLFGHTFDLYYHMYYFEPIPTPEKFEIKLCHGAMLGFDIFNEENRREHLIGIGKFLSDEKAKNELRDIIYVAEIHHRQLNEVGDQIKNKLNHPTQEDVDEWVKEQEKK